MSLRSVLCQQLFFTKRNFLFSFLFRSRTCAFDKNVELLKEKAFESLENVTRLKNRKYYFKAENFFKKYFLVGF